MSLAFSSVSFSYPGQKPLLLDVSVTFPENGLVIILGKSGCGKTTLLSLIVGSLSPTHGEIKRDKKSFASPVFQSPLLLPYLTVYENVALPLDLNGIHDPSRVQQALNEVGLADFKNQYPEKLSGGEKARVSLARGLVLSSSLLVLDEPTGQLDEKNSDIILSLIKELSHSRLIVLVTHDEVAALKYGDSLYLLKDGKLIPQKEAKNGNIAKKKAKNSPDPKPRRISFFKGTRILYSYLKNHAIRVLLTTVFLAFSLSILATGLNFSRHFSFGLGALMEEFADYSVVKISRIETIASEGHLSVLRNRTPTAVELARLSLLDSEQDLSFFLPEYQEIALNRHYGNVRLLPLLDTKKDNHVMVNDSFLKEFSLTREKALASSLTLVRSVLVSTTFFPETDFLSYSFSFEIQGISREKNLFNEPTIYYSHAYVKDILSDMELPNISSVNIEIENLGSLFEDPVYENEDLFSHARLVQTENPFLLKEKGTSLFDEEISMTSKALALEEETSDMLSSLLKIGLVFLLLAMMSAFMLEFLSVYSLYDENLRLFALAKVYSKKSNTLRFSLLNGFLFLSLTFFFLLFFICLESTLINWILSYFGYPAFLAFLDVPSLFVTTLFALLLSLVSGILPLAKIQPSKIKNELEGED